MIRRAIAIVLVTFAAAEAVASDAETISQRLARAQSLAWAKQFEDAARIYLRVLDQAPDNHDAILGLGRVRLWQGRYGEASALFRRLLKRNAADVDALEGSATAAYWSGDYRTAERQFARIVAAHPQRETARRSLGELRAAAATTERFTAGVVDDDQPFRSSRLEARVSMFTDPLTRWDGLAGAYTVSSEVGGRHAAPFAFVSNETVLPAARLTVTTTLGAIRTPDHRTRALGGIGGRLRLPREHSISLSWNRREMLATATRLYPLVDIASLRWDHEKPWLAAAAIERHRFSDRNTAVAGSAYALFPVAKPAGFTIWAGASALARDTRDSRFYVSGISATLDPSGAFFHYTYRGAYDPYWTPHDLVEGRAIVAVERRVGSANVRVQGDGGWARDRAVGFFPGSGPTSFPSEIGSITFVRHFEPWRIRLTSSMPVAHGMTVDVSFEHSVTAFYRANSIHAAVARRR